jgi:hypothetical protein
MRKVFLSALAVMMLISVAAYAHHSYAATYDTSKEIKLSGKLMQFSFKNPHSYVTVQAKDAKGVVQRWSIEWAGTSQLGTRGITQDTLKIGDEVQIVGRPSRVTGEFKALMVNLKRPSDGFSWGSNAGDVVD